MMNDRLPKLYISRSDLVALLSKTNGDRKHRHVTYLSHRNVKTLLSKLERDAAGDDTHCTLIKNRQPGGTPFNQTLGSLAVIGVQDEDWNESSYSYTLNNMDVFVIPDEEYYGSQHRPAGMMHPFDEEKLYQPTTGVVYSSDPL